MKQPSSLSGSGRCRASRLRQDARSRTGRLRDLPAAAVEADDHQRLAGRLRRSGADRHRRRAADEPRRARRCLASLGITPSSVTHLLATHHHRTTSVSRPAARGVRVPVHIHPAGSSASTMRSTPDRGTWSGHSRRHGMPIPTEPVDAPEADGLLGEHLPPGHRGGPSADRRRGAEIGRRACRGSGRRATRPATAASSTSTTACSSSAITCCRASRRTSACTRKLRATRIWRPVARCSEEGRGARRPAVCPGARRGLRVTTGIARDS